MIRWSKISYLDSMKSGETNLKTLLQSMQPKLNEGEYVFCSVKNPDRIDLQEIIGSFREEEGVTIIIEKDRADKLQLPYTFISSWITLTVHSSLEAIGLTAAFSKALADEGISCNAIAGFYHDHIFVPIGEKDKAMVALKRLAYT